MRRVSAVILEDLHVRARGIILAPAVPPAFTPPCTALSWLMNPPTKPITIF